MSNTPINYNKIQVSSITKVVDFRVSDDVLISNYEKEPLWHKRALLLCNMIIDVNIPPNVSFSCLKNEKDPKVVLLLCEHNQNSSHLVSKRIIQICSTMRVEHNVNSYILLIKFSHDYSLKAVENENIINFFPKNASSQDIKYIGDMAVKYYNYTVFAHCVENGYVPDEQVLYSILNINTGYESNNWILNKKIQNYRMIIKEMSPELIKMNWYNKISVKYDFSDRDDVNYKIKLLTSLVEEMVATKEQVLGLYDRMIFVNLKTSAYDYSNDFEIFYNKIYNFLVDRKIPLNSRYDFSILMQGNSKIYNREYSRIYLYKSGSDMYSANLTFIGSRTDSKVITHPSLYCISKKYDLIGCYDKDNIDDLIGNNIISLTTIKEILKKDKLSLIKDMISNQSYPYNYIKYAICCDIDFCNRFAITIKKNIVKNQIVLTPKAYYAALILNRIYYQFNRVDLLLDETINMTDEDYKEIGYTSILGNDYYAFNICFQNGYLPDKEVINKLFNIDRSIYIILSNINSGNSNIDDELNSHFTILDNLLFNLSYDITIDEFININKERRYNICKSRVTNYNKIFETFITETLRRVSEIITEEDIIKLYENEIYASIKVDNFYDFEYMNKKLFHIIYANDKDYFPINHISETIEILFRDYPEILLRNMCSNSSFTHIKKFSERYKLKLDQYCINLLYSNHAFLTYINKKNINLPPPSDYCVLRVNKINLIDFEFKSNNVLRDDYISLCKDVDVNFF